MWLINASLTASHPLRRLSGAGIRRSSRVNLAAAIASTAGLKILSLIAFVKVLCLSNHAAEINVDGEGIRGLGACYLTANSVSYRCQ